MRTIPSRVKIPVRALGARDWLLIYFAAARPDMGGSGNFYTSYYDAGVGAPPVSRRSAEIARQEDSE